MRFLWLWVLVMAAAATGAQAARPGLTDHPLISSYRGSDLKKKDVKDFDEYRAFTGLDGDKKPSGPTLEGKITKLFYKNPRGRSILEIFRNYEAALHGAGAEILHVCDQEQGQCVPKYAQRTLTDYNGISAIGNTAGRYVIGRIAKEGHTAYIAVAVGAAVTAIHVVEIEGMDTGMVTLNAAALGDGLDRDGYVIVEGIFFDTDRASLKPESRPAMEEVAKLLRGRADLKLFVVGHTDMQGSLAHNMKLSRDRAQAVADALVGDYAIAAGRLKAHGVGPLAPQAANASDSGRARNRRVVLVVR